MLGESSRADFKECPLSRSTRIFVAFIAVVAAITPSAFAGKSSNAVVKAAGGSSHKPATYLVGGGVASINPTAEMLANNDFYLGGYGFGNGRIAGQQIPAVSEELGERYAIGILGDGSHSRAFAVSDSKHTIVLGQIETQGYFAAYKQGPFGITEIRQDASAAIAALAAKQKKPAPVPAASEILVDSNHSHGGPDTPGVWGGVPTSYLKLVHDRTVQAIVDAWKNMKKSTLYYGMAHAGVEGMSQYPPTGGSDPLLTNQFRTDPNNQMMDDEIRVFQARDSSGTVIDTYVNYASHPTVLGSSNRRVTGDYTGRLNLAMEKAFGGFAMQQVATLGREQPSRGGCPTKQGSDSDPTIALCALDAYAARVVVKVKAAIAAAKPLVGSPIVAMNSYLLADPATSPVLAGLIYMGSLIGVPAGRAGNPPWYTVNLIGTTYFTGRIGDVLMVGSPGEPYAQIWDKVRKTVPGMRGYMSIGTAGDFLGYIIAPLEAYPEPIRRSILSGDPPPVGDPACALGGVSIGCPDPVGNDNYFFNVSHTFGERLTCDFLRGAGDILSGDPTTYWLQYERCPLFVTDLALPPGFDTTFPQQPDLSAAMPHM